MTWTSVINEMPDVWYIQHFEPDSTEYEEWLEKVMAEPWVRALQDMVKWTKVRVGTEQQLFEELEMRVGKEVFASPDFPSDFSQLDEYVEAALDGFYAKGLNIMHYREITPEDLNDFDVPGWGPETPIIIFEGHAAYRLDFWSTQFALLKFWHPVPLAIFMLAASKKFTKSPDFEKSRSRTYTTRELSRALSKHYPRYDNIPRAAAAARPEGVDELLPTFASLGDLLAMDEPYGREEHLFFHKQMEKWAPILKEVARIKISRQKRTTFPGLPESNDTDRPAKTYWTIEAPLYEKPDLFGCAVWLTWSRF